MHRRFFNLFFVLTIILCEYSFAQQRSANTAILATEKKQSLNFEDELIEGSAQKPEFFYLFQKKNLNYKRLIKLRENFIPEMQRSAENIQRLRGGR